MTNPTTISPYSSYFRRRTIGRAASPPTWAWYEQIPYDDEDYSDSRWQSEDDSCSEDGGNYHASDRPASAVLAFDSQDDAHVQYMGFDEADCYTRALSSASNDEKNPATPS